MTHHTCIYLFEMNFHQNEPGKRTGICSSKTVLSNTVAIYGYKIYAKKIY